MGDLGLGLTKPMPLDGKVWMLGGFLPAAPFGAAVAGVDFFSATVAAGAFLSAGFDAANLGVRGFWGLVGVLTLRPVDLVVTVFAVALAVEIALGRVFVVVFGAALVASLGALTVLGIFERMGREDVAAAGAAVLSFEAPFAALLCGLAIRRRETPPPRASGDFLGASDVVLPVSIGLLRGFANSFLTGDFSAGAAAGLFSLFSLWSCSLLEATGVGAEGLASVTGARTLGVAPRTGFEIEISGVPALTGDGVVSSGIAEGFRFGVCATKMGRASSGEDLTSGTPVWDVVGVGTSPSVPALMVRERVGMESLLVSRWRPTRPSFSTVTKLVRTRESGRGESACPGVPSRPRSGGLESPLCSNMARRFLT